MKTIDIGCGSKKSPDSVGMDIHAYDGVDVVHDINSHPWPLEDKSFDKVICTHVIEHVDSVAGFMAEIHRISADGAIVEVRTPHFSSINSWADPTHKYHFALQWPRVFTGDGYLVPQVGRFEVVENRIEFGQFFAAKIGKLICRFRGAEKWEKNSAFRYPGMDIWTTLRVVR